MTFDEKKLNLVVPKILIFYFAFLFCQILSGQNMINGVIKDKDSHHPVPYASIYVPQKGYGVLGDADGNFQFDLTKLDKTDSVRISAIGYEILILTKEDLTKYDVHLLFLKPLTYEIQEVEVKPRKQKYLGTIKYSKKNCSAFAGEDPNWRGKQVAIRANNEEDVKVFVESFGFYIVKNEYNDSLTFRVMLYEIGDKGLPGKTFLQKPVIFKTNIKQGEVLIDLKEYNIVRTGDFFISLECLEETMESAKFCFAGSIKVPSYFKSSAFGRWGKVKGGGADLNLKVSYKK
jgi:hypothetical protein